MNCQDHINCNLPPRELARRWFLKECGVGLGAMALAHLAGNRSAAAASSSLDAKLPTIAPKAKSVIYLFMAGAPSHLELFDYKPQLAKFDGTLPPAELLKGIEPRSSIPTRSCWGRSSSSPSTASAAPSFPSCCRTWRPWSMTSRS